MCIRDRCEAVVVDEERGEFSVNGHVLKRGDVITIDGSHGKVFLGEIELQEPAIGGDFATLMSWADAVSYTHLDVYKRQGYINRIPVVSFLRVRKDILKAPMTPYAQVLR